MHAQVQVTLPLVCVFSYFHHLQMAWTLAFSSSQAVPRWLAVYIVLSLVAGWSIPLAHTVPPISPATLVYAPQDAAVPLLLSPFLIPSCSAFFLRVLHVLWLFTHFHTASGLPAAPIRPMQLLITYLSLVAVRSVLGFVFTRGIGWMYPALLAPYALYEPLYGIGPLIAGAVLFDHGVSISSGSKVGIQGSLPRLAVLAVFAMVDGLPWSYACAAAIEGVLRLSNTLFAQRPATAYESIPLEGVHDAVDSLPPPYSRTAQSPSYLSKPRLILLSIAAIGTSWIFGSIPHYTTSSVSHQPWTSAAAAAEPIPDVHILMLTYPRDKDLTSDYTIDSILSYLDGWRDAGLGAANTTLTVYAHPGTDRRHRAWGRAQAFFSATAALWHGSGVALDFVMHPPAEAAPSHYAHLADALRYAYRAGHEWTMVVEDDFAVCGAWGADGIARVMRELGSTLAQQDDADTTFSPGIVEDITDVGAKRGARWRGAFVGTGGSGLVLHHTLLPTIIELLELVPTLSMPGAPQPQTPPDVLVQQCLSGEIALCSAVVSPPDSGEHHSGRFERSPFPALPRVVPVPDLPPLLTPSAPPAFLVSSRMLMAHNGHAMSTGGRTYHEGQWACGWRQPMLGNRGVSVLVV